MMGIRFPEESPVGLGVGMDLPWGGNVGFEKRPEGDGVRAKVGRFLARYVEDFSYLSFSFQPRSRNRFTPEEYFAPYDDLVRAAGALPVRVLHQTVFNMGATTPYDRAPLAEFTNRLIERYGFRWVVEDLGVWSLAGKALPYPQPPFLTPEGLRACIRNIRELQERLLVPLCVEFPGFSEGSTVVMGSLDAFDFFRVVAEETGSPVTLDVGHLLSYQWLSGRGGARMLEGMDRLPLAHCHELHLSGCQIVRGRFRDLHHGLLLDEQIALLDYLLQHCPALRAVTYEDPCFTEDGKLVPKSLRNYGRLKERVARWAEERR